ncbi:BTB/POZ domain-containing protein 2 [Anabrus simplex]|uniref:BTB/POZ domain-containing protein 2 n=1 Tax=Anabrus simplex TaxID=316456 RepID=UPI0034DD9162
MEERDSITGSTMEERAQSLLDTGLGSDCKFVVGDDKNKVIIDASKAFLIRASPVFERMFFSQFQVTEPIEVPDIEPDVFKTMLRFIYGCKWSFESNDQAVKLCYAANKYMIAELLARCEEYLWPNNVENVWTALLVANLYSLEKLRNAAIQIIHDNSYAIVENPDVANITQNCLLTIVKGRILRIHTEVLVFRMCVQWATARCEEKGLAVNGHHLRSELGEILKYIRFLAMEPEEFVLEVVRTGILIAEESLSILSFLVTGGKTPPPFGLCPVKTTRINDYYLEVTYDGYIDAS